MSAPRVTIVGAGLAGSECAWQLARRGHRVRLFEMRPNVGTSAHQTDRLRGARLLELLPFRQPAQRRRPAEARDGGARLARHPLGARGGRAGGRRPGDGPHRLRRPRDRGDRGAPRDRARARGGARDPGGGLRRPRDGAADLAGARRRDRRAARDRGPLLLRLDGADRRGLVARPLEDVRAVALRQGRRRRLLELPALARRVRALSRRAASRARRCRSTTSRRASTSRAACRSR